VVERWTPKNTNVLNYEGTIEDPQVFSHPWKISVPLYRHQEKSFQLRGTSACRTPKTCFTGLTGDTPRTERESPEKLR
jgi:hypothetical protein